MFNVSGRRCSWSTWVKDVWAMKSCTVVRARTINRRACPVIRCLVWTHAWHGRLQITSSARTRRGGSCLKVVLLYKSFLIYRTFMRRAPARPVRACFVRTCCAVVVQGHDLRATPAQCNAKRALSSHFTLHSSHPALHTSHLHFTRHTSCHFKSCELFSPHLSSSHLIPSLLTCHLSKFFLTIFISSEHCSTFLISRKFFSTHLSSSALQKAFTVREKSLAHKSR